MSALVEAPRSSFCLFSRVVSHMEERDGENPKLFKDLGSCILSVAHHLLLNVLLSHIMISHIFLFVTIRFGRI